MKLRITAYGQDITDTISPGRIRVTMDADGSTFDPAPPCTGPGELSMSDADTGRRYFHAVARQDDEGVWYWSSPWPPRDPNEEPPAVTIVLSDTPPPHGPARSWPRPY
jgi:hypothetical protein